MPPKVTFLDPECACPPPPAVVSPAPDPSPTCHHHHPNLTEILPGLFLGNLAAAESAAVLAATGITHVLSLTTTPPRIPQGYIHKHHPLHDTPTANLLAVLPDCVARIEHLLRGGGGGDDGGGKRVLVHCCMGRSRSGAVVVAYVMKARQCAYAPALEAVVAKRAVVRPNSGFVRQLAAWGEARGSPWVCEEAAAAAAAAVVRPRVVRREGSRRRRSLFEEEWVVVEEVGEVDVREAGEGEWWGGVGTGWWW